ncbi:pyridoxal phosphate-dependent aminotransferase [Desulfovibrio sulfodismutans]|uniref:Aminotransferase n=1 Tax=Desulfolutivibrio sulfodismutans TaxID=63561 RepID=A0A7K3NP77_9BACT|nr:pyridoxal phosphate-dependent aminotransferase [Desulfolutivibrio sulfodismutans]NDY57643.1 pyridoxal phosphate-dependent aminotransferase [Desulfolutivibrio sulfodismutans]QLA14064.1 pyridoxal phosphate-dependent aminotransferase [Desulfolutivibrio sulfodismutans DSM 3696]
MRLLTREMDGYLAGGAWIRKIFELGLELKKKYGEDAVCDFSLGNPDLPPPAAVGKRLAEIAAAADRPFAFGYMPNPGYPAVREALAGYVSRQQETHVSPNDLVVTCGAAGGLNIFFRAVLEPGDEVICPSPYFVEYGFYVANSGGVLRPVPSRAGDFGLDVAAIAAAVTDKTRAVLINSPNNPTGQIYPAEDIAALAAALTELSKGRERPIFLVADEPYRFLTFDGHAVPPILPVYPYSLVVSSFSKNLSLAGERVGFVAVSPDMPQREKLVGGLVFANRIMGFVNAPAIGQAVLLGALDAQVDTSIYARRRDAMAGVLSRTGYDFFMPRGAFYFFPVSPIPDEVAFVSKLAEHRVLAVPGRGFGLPGYFRLAFCVDEAIILRAEEGLAKARSAF